ncbi:NAD(P)-dependent oxidoreductase [Candidatus Kaiserbacteria bacterium]|nr:NAD(P)-dependent oxidoreductase [Candidatus Kaiserbacteria bacterium]
MDSILITGGDGVLGSYCYFGTRLGRSELDITDFAAVMKVCVERKPKVIVHCAALTDLAFCEKNQDKAYLVNAIGTYHLALGARSVGAKLIYVSTSDVFDGTKGESYTTDDIPNPMSAYARSKHLGELVVQGTLDNHLIVRISWMFGGGPKKDTKFVGKILMQKGSPEIRAITDKKASPVWAKDIAGAIQKLVDEGRRGICHLSGGSATRYDMAQEIVGVMGWKSKVIPVLSSEFPLIYPIGEDQSMSLSPLMRPWQASLREYIQTEWNT